ncbi:YpdA family putative bacillithiol disulfide reductase [Chitinophaga sp. sic0106]|uniref:YpdA family putative bacillithiol disulfide reductase n=1 Tax=Chitinophaga sp. sic0106 TaxID=2854785 RepID=UPI001C454908|nr:YpdA family putative bacillithiol disulfide reductase [Chitinophaga sp. sic0106]MBV7531142.1 YpdA family putative bacillithiol disulfide reductase [Chitinophaga sp. sic0106]
MDAAYDVIIIGGGPIGIACALTAQRAGLSYLVIEKGCLTNSLYNYPLYMTFFSTSERLEVGNIPFVCINPKPNRPEALEYYRRVTTSNQLNVKLFEEVTDILPNGNEYTVHTTKGKYHGRHVVIATGFYDIPNTLDIPGENLAKVTHYYKDPHFYATRKVIVIGANNSAVDAALETYRKGAQVTMIIREDGIGKRVKYWVKPDIENRISEGSIKAYYHSSLAAVRENEADILTPDGIVTIPNDFVIAMTGYQPNFSFLKKAGIALSDDAKKYPAYNPITMETNMPRIYLAGVVCGGMDTHVWFIENSRDHADKIIQHIRSRA